MKLRHTANQFGTSQTNFCLESLTSITIEPNYDNMKEIRFINPMHHLPFDPSTVISFLIWSSKVFLTIQCHCFSGRSTLKISPVLCLATASCNFFRLAMRLVAIHGILIGELFERSTCRSLIHDNFPETVNLGFG